MSNNYKLTKKKDNKMLKNYTDQKMTLFYKSLILLSFILLNSSFAELNDNFPKTLRESLRLAMKLNPKTVATDELMESIHYSTLVIKTSSLPSGSLSCSANRVNSEISLEGFHKPISQITTSKNCGLFVGYNLYDGGASHYRTLSAEASGKATRASYDTSDSLIPNTRGSLANSTISNFIQFSQSKQRIELLKYIRNTLLTFQKFTNTDNLKVMIFSTNQSLQQLVDIFELNKKAFQYIVTIPPSEDIESIDSAIKSMKIPATSDEAIELALTKGPVVQRRNLNVEMAEHNLNATKASIGPTINLSFGWTKGISESDTITHNTSRSVGVTLNIPFGVSSVYSIKSASKYLDSMKSQREAAINDAKNSIQVTYSLLQSQKNKYESSTRIYSDQIESLKIAVAKINSSNTSGLILSDLLVGITNLQTQFLDLQNTQSTILMSLYSIQQLTGILFTDFIGE